MMSTTAGPDPDQTDHDPRPEDEATSSVAETGPESDADEAGVEEDAPVEAAPAVATKAPAVSGDELEQAAALAAASERVRSEVAKVIVGQSRVVDHLLIALFSRGHSVFIGVPGLAKTLLVSTMARVLDLGFSRIQFTPDLMPADITGTEVLEEDKGSGRRSFRFVPGPLFANVILADEVNRTPPKTQADLLQAMQEREVSSGGTNHALPDPFLVFATQNPIEQEGTYPLPEAQLDRFMLSVQVSYPSEAEEVRIVEETTSDKRQDVERVLSAEDILGFQELVRRVPISERLAQSAVRLVRATRPGEVQDEYVRKWVEWGAGPRASQNLVLAAKARALISGRHAVSDEDLRELAPAVLGHRVVVNFRAEAEGLGSGDIVEHVLRKHS
ncbi:MAG: MoxR family ATPase [Acidobacteriota bacterium]